MPCTTILIGRRATHDGSTMVARNEDSMAGEFTPKRLRVVMPQDQPMTYVSTLSKFTLELPSDPMRYTALPNALPNEGIWAAAGVNEADVGMSATETIIMNERVLAADPLVEYRPAKGEPGEPGYEPEQVGGIGEEDMVTIVLPYIRSAREGVLRLGKLLEKLGTYESNGIAFHDDQEVWWLETIGGHHWIARRVPDDCYVTMANQLGIDRFDLDDAEGEGTEFLCSADLRAFVADNNLDLTMRDENGLGFKGERPSVFNPRDAFGTANDADHVYNTPRTWEIQRHLNPHACVWDGEGADLTPASDDIPWCRMPERKLTPEDVKYVLSLHYQGTPYDPYGAPTTPDMRNSFRPIGVNRTSQLSLTQIRSQSHGDYRSLQWIAFGSNPFNALVPLFANVEKAPTYFATCDKEVSTESFYWTSRLIGALADASLSLSTFDIERYQSEVVARCRAVLAHAERVGDERDAANDEVARIVRRLTADLLAKVLHNASMSMRNSFARSDA